MFLILELFRGDPVRKDTLFDDIMMTIMNRGDVMVCDGVVSW